MTRFVRCINNHRLRDRLTVNKVYAVIDSPRIERIGRLRILDDRGVRFIFSEVRFLPAKEPADGKEE